MQNIGDKIKDLRKRKNISQEELAEKIFVSRQTVSKWENDAVLPNMDNISQLCAYFDVDLNYFLVCGEMATIDEYVHNNKKEKRKIGWVMPTFTIILGLMSIMFLFVTIVCGIIAFSVLKEMDDVVRTVNANIFSFIGLLLLTAVCVVSVVVLIIKMLKLKGVK